MVFSKLSVQEKDAFFGLLDEYFQSRPELFGQGGGSQGGSGLAGTGISTAAAASVVQRALGSNASTGTASSKSNNNPYAAALATSNVTNADVANAVKVGRVAAASLAFSQAQGGGGGGGSGGGGPPFSSPSPLSLIQRANANANLKPPTSDSTPSLPRRTSPMIPSGEPGAEVDKLVARKASVMSAFKKQPTAGVSLPPAFPVPKNTFGPPPMRRTASEAGASAGAGVGGGAGANAAGTRAPSQPTRAAPPVEEEVAEGEWAEVLYDYSSEDPGDLTIQAGMRVFVTERPSEDWWKGQVEGQEGEGLFPASYIKLL